MTTKLEVYDNGQWVPRESLAVVEDYHWMRGIDHIGHVYVIPGRKINGRYTHRPPGPDYAPSAALGLEDDVA